VHHGYHCNGKKSSDGWKASYKIYDFGYSTCGMRKAHLPLA